MSDALLIQAQPRERAGTGVARSLRMAGNVPAVVYGKGEESKLISISQKEADMLCHVSQLRSATVNIRLGDKNYVALPKEFTLHPVTDLVEHVGFMLVGDAVSEIQIDIPIRIKGKEKSPGIKKGGILNLVFRSLPCKVVKDKIPPYIEIDVSSMEVGVTLQLKDIILPEGVKLLLKDLNPTFLRLTGKRAVVESKATEGQVSSADGATEAKEGQAKPDDKKKEAADQKGKK
jgi:large subunit ribosomal protein L25